MIVVVLLVGLVAGLVLGRGVFSGEGRGSIRSTPLVEDTAGGATGKGSPSVVWADPAPPAAPVPAETAVEDAEAALEGFLAAEYRGDTDASWALLAAGDRRRYGNPRSWEHAHADLPPITGHDAVSYRGDDRRIEATAVVTLEAGLDQVAGLTPPRANATWVVVAEDDGWRVAHADSVMEPLWDVDVAAAPVAAHRWAESRLACAPAGEHAAGLLGFAVLADELCEATGSVTVGDTTELPSDADADAFAAAFGDEVFEWARVVPVPQPVSLRAVLAPVDGDWLVIGVLPGKEQG